MTELVFLKLGGSLITDKTRPFTPRLELLNGLARQLGNSLAQYPDMRLVLGHGSGSFGHTPAAQHHTREGVHSREDWQGFSEVWWQASALNRIVMGTLHEAGLPAVAQPPLASVTARDGRVSAWDLGPVRSALQAGLLPVVYGDVVFDEVRGGTILSTEDLFAHLAHALQPARILLAGLEAAVWADFPARRRPAELLTRATFDEIQAGIGAASGADVTGGMLSKVSQMLDLVEQVPGLTVTIFSGEGAGALERALRGEPVGTRIA